MFSQVLFAVCVAAFWRLTGSAPGLPGHSGHQRSREYEGWKIRICVVEEQELQLSILNSLINHLFT